MIVYLGIGSNIQPELNINKAKQALTAAFDEVTFSRVYESAAVGFEGDNFHNLVARLETTMSLDALIEQLKAMEDSLGRLREGAKFSSRHIDIDVLLYGDMVCELPIQLPRDEITENAYVLWPMAELAPELIHPGTKDSYSALWKAFDKSQQQIRPLP
ncbi:2-amino-4-hydroxy-6-hydroxymethyldihydropteridine diphosphokinase [Aliikangiella sp. G2MR2-5]|uniref:2-amino-4-hydroxy-6- hydroxymethyldihydropteridine diphosphokinase n=1 Tax=Aliikangiella sp. G2MR2-5 TaxID=2788943 RepID=UPI0018AA8D35|nr:2-amino-4-hydroxy-6-hydroxymethyldihydropteridine diphosphokinase [Aliikangiella sp. G2MR2-5]